jgi:phosphate uptake regulator
MLVEVFDELRSEMRQDIGVVDRAVSMICFAKHLERLADHTTNLAEMVMFLVRGEDVRRGTGGDVQPAIDSRALGRELPRARHERDGRL